MTPALYVYRTRHPLYAHDVIIDACAESADAALRSLRRFVARENRRLRRAGVPRSRLIRRPQAWTIGVEPRRPVSS
jgi:hypothetical protein